LGWIGRNSCLIVPGGGSYYFISVIFSRLALVADLPVMADHCPPSCNKCLEKCPTEALVAPGRLDARKCIAYHTIENKGEIDQAVSEKNSEWIFGCDICQEVCPWNRRPRGARRPIGEINSVLNQLDRAGWLSLSHNEFLEYFRKTPIHRTGYQRLMRNVEACLRTGDRAEEEKGA
ncbi:MAG: tRNA epoxyqueuosine(34) reductase QueG, partial [Bacteroidetes bacterium HGW-Bacteroidetes-22]